MCVLIPDSKRPGAAVLFNAGCNEQVFSKTRKKLTQIRLVVFEKKNAHFNSEK